MERETILSDDFVTLYYYPGKGVVYHILHKYKYGEPFRKFLMTGVETLRKNKGTKWLSDDRSYATLTKEDLEWGPAVFAPAAIKAGWKYWAIVMPEKVVGRMAMAHVVELYGKLGVTVQIVESPEEGMAWLDSQT